MCIFICSFIDENGERYDALTTLRINGENVLALNSPKVVNTIINYDISITYVTKGTELWTSILLLS